MLCYVRGVTMKETEKQRQIRLRLRLCNRYHVL